MLSPARPSDAVALPADPGADSLRVTLDQANPDGQAFSVVVATVDRDGTEVRLGSFAPFPVRAAGAFVIGLEAGRAALRSQPTWRLEFRLEPVAASQTLRDPLEVTISAIELRP
jgi:hypothetical protein